MSFVTHSGSSDISFESIQQIIQSFPYETIIIIGGTIFTIYGYAKLLIAAYHYLDSKFAPKIDHSTIIYNSAKFLIDLVTKTDSMKRIHRIYIAALKLEYFI